MAGMIMSVFKQGQDKPRPVHLPTYWQDNGTSVSGDFAGLYRHDGVLVSDSSATGKSRRWLGIIYTYNNGGTVNFKDDVNYRYINNFYNRKDRVVTSFNTNTSWTDSSTSWQEWNNGNGQIRGNFVDCLTNSRLANLGATPIHSNGGNAVYMAIGFNSASSQTIIGYATAPATDYNFFAGCFGSIVVPCGYNWITCQEYINGNTLTNRSDSGVSGCTTLYMNG